MRIALIAPMPPSDGASGPSATSFHLGLGLARLGHEVEVIAWLGEKSEPASWAPELQTRQLANPRILRLAENATALTLEWGRYAIRRDELLGFSILARDLRGAASMCWARARGRLDDFDVIEAPEWGGACAALAGAPPSQVRLARLHASLYSHALRYGRHARFARAEVIGATAVEKAGLLHADCVLAPSSAILEDAQRAFGPLRHVELLPNCVDLEYIDGCLAGLPARRPDPSRLLVTFVGRIDGPKGAHILDAIVRLLRTPHPAINDVQWDLCLVGDPGSLSRYPSLMTLVGGAIRVFPCGHLDTVETLRLLGQSDVLLFPSQAENCPMAVLEAMACGAVVVASAVGGIVEMVEDQHTGLLCPPDDPQAFVDALIRLADQRRRNDFADAARARCEHAYSSTTVGERWVTLVENIREGRPK